MKKPFSLVISDLHLSEANKAGTTLFREFITHIAPQAETLYILGDLFEFWIGDDDLTPYHQEIIALIASLKAHKTKVFVMHGNRDFLMGQHFLNACHATLLKDPSVIDCYDTKTLMIHGDSLCTDDTRYQRYRRVVNLKPIRWLFRCMPLWLRRHIALKLRNSNPHAYRNDRPINEPHPADVTDNAVQQAFKQYNVKRIIHGHTHRYAVHRHSDGLYRYVLGDWHDYGSCLLLDHQGIAMYTLHEKLTDWKP